MLTPVSTIDREEHIGDVGYVANAPAGLAGAQNYALPNDRYYFGIRFEVEGRFTNPAANGPTGILPDGIFGLIEQVTIRGRHRIRKQQEDFVVLRGADLRELSAIYAGRAPGVTYLDNGASANALSIVANHTNDFRYFFDIIFPPEALPPAQQMDYILDAPNYDNLQLIIQWADHNNVFSGQTVAVPLTAYGSAAGVPQCRIHGLFTQAGMPGSSVLDGFVPGRVFRTFFELTNGDIVNGKVASRLYDIARGYRVRSLLVKTGTKSAAVTGNNNAYATLVNTILSNIYIMRGTNRQIRKWTSYMALREAAAAAYQFTPDNGYALIDFAKKGNVRDAADTRNMVNGPSGDIAFFLQSDVAAGANQAALFVTQEIRSFPRYPAVKVGGRTFARHPLGRLIPVSA